MTPTERIIITAMSLTAAVIILLGFAECTQKYNSEQNAIQLAHELR